jgi:hypothetical protein
MPALRITFRIGALLTGIAAVLSAMRGQRYMNETKNPVSDISKCGPVEGEKKAQT